MSQLEPAECWEGFPCAYSFTGDYAKMPSMKFNRHEEKRRFMRHPVGLPVFFNLAEDSGRSKTHLQDLSEGGVSFLGLQPFDEGSFVHLRIPLGDKVFEMDGRVAYCQTVAGNKNFRIGIQFTDPKSSFRLRLAEQIAEIQAYRRQLSLDSGGEVSEEEAADLWIQKYAARFAELF